MQTALLSACSPCSSTKLLYEKYTEPLYDRAIPSSSTHSKTISLSRSWMKYEDTTSLA